MDYFLFNFSGVQFHYTMSPKNNFCNYYKLINLAYLYDKTHYDLQTSTGEKYYYFNLLQDDRLKKENIQEFMSSYCRKHNK